MVPKKKTSGPPLSRERIVASALGIVDREGLDSLSMRRLGAELGADPMAVYYHIPNKGALLDALVEAVMSEIDLSGEPAGTAEDRILWAACAYRDAMLAHPNALPIVLARGPTSPGAMRPVEVLLGVLRQAGLRPEQATAGMNAIAAMVRGIVAMVEGERVEPPSSEALAEFGAPFPVDDFPYLHEAMRHAPDYVGRDFEFGVRALAQGLLADAGDRAAPGTTRPA